MGVYITRHAYSRVHYYDKRLYYIGCSNFYVQSLSVRNILINNNDGYTKQIFQQIFNHRSCEDRCDKLSYCIGCSTFQVENFSIRKISIIRNRIEVETITSVISSVHYLIESDGEKKSGKKKKKQIYKTL